MPVVQICRKVCCVVHDSNLQKTSSLTARSPGGEIASAQIRPGNPAGFAQPAARLFNSRNRENLLLQGQFVDERSATSVSFPNVFRDVDLPAVKALCATNNPNFGKWSTGLG